MLIVVAVASAGCGGAKMREAKHMAKGQQFLADGNFEKARIEFRNALQIAPNDSDARYYNGVVDEKLGNLREAAQYYQGAVDSNGDNTIARGALGRLFVVSGAPDSALDVIKPSLLKHPDDPELLTVRAAARIELKDPEGAREDAERAVKLAPHNEDAVETLAGIYKSSGAADKASELLESTIKQMPDSVDLRLSLAQLYASQGKEPEVEQLLIELVRLKPNDASQRLRLAQYYSRLNHLDESERVLREAIKTLPADNNLKIALVQFLSARRSKDAATTELASMIAQDPKNNQLKFAQAQLFVQAKEFDQAENTYRAIIAANDSDAAGITARDSLAALLIQNGKTPDAQKLLAEVLTKNPRDNDALVMRGNLALQSKDPKSAIADLRSVLRDQPNSIGVMRTLARAHLANGEPELAEETMRRALEVNPKDSGARLDLAGLLVQLGKPAQAKPVVDELVKQEPGNLQALDLQFHADLATNDNVDAKTAADTILTLQPKEPVGSFYEGIVAEAQKRPEDALRFYSAALAARPEAPEPLERLCHVLVASNRAAEALKRLDDVEARYPQLPYASNIKGEILASNHRTADAKAAFGISIERAPKWQNAYQNLVLMQMQEKDPEGAAATLQQGIKQVDHPDAFRIELASIYERLGRPDDAIGVYDAALKIDPHSDVAANNLAMLLITYKKDKASLDRAKDLTQRFANSSNSAFLDTYGWVLFKSGDAASAVTALQSAVSKAPDSPASLYHLGMAQASAGLDDAARDSLTRSLKLGKNFLGKDEAQTTLDRLAKLGPSSQTPRS
jgi:tetratricopeptide (TPR) repeat protein